MTEPIVNTEEVIENQGAAPEGSAAVTEVNNDIPVDNSALFKQIEELTGVKVDNIDQIKERLSYTPPPATPTEEEEKRKLQESENKVVEKFLKGGKTAEEYTNYKQVANADARELAIQSLRLDMAKKEYSESQIEKTIKAITLEVSQEEIDEMYEEDKADYLKQKEVAEKMLKDNGELIKKQAQANIDFYKNQITDEESEATKIEQHATNVVGAINGFDKKMSITLGKYDDVDLPPVDFNFSDDVIKNVQSEIVDAVKFENNFLKQDGSLNLEYFVPILAKAKAFEEAVKTGYLQGRHNQVEFYQSTFGGSKPDLGGGSKPISNAAVRRGAPQQA